MKLFERNEATEPIEGDSPKEDPIDSVALPHLNPWLALVLLLLALVVYTLIWAKLLGG